tara:strand:- start:1611 stop:1859 length:249 start_codon:yes stop_codon:yes gene_type:complete
MKYSYLIKVCVVISFLSGCAAIDNINAQNKAKLLNTAKESCIEYGFKEGTDNFAGCIQKEVNEFKNRKAIEDASRRDGKFLR